MKSKPVSSCHSVTTGELLAMCKLVQVVTHAGEYDTITETVWKEKIMEAFGMESEGAEALLNKSRRLSNRILASVEAQ
jgi:hypothetical protein